MVSHSSLSTRVILTVSYSTQFSFPLTLKEIWTRIISSYEIPFVEVEKTVKQLVAAGILKYESKYIVLAQSPVHIATREERSINSIHKMAEVTDFLRFAKKIPWIQAVAITGSMAVNNAKKDDDIDFMIITNSKRLWITRLCVIAVAMYKRKRRSFGKEEKNSWCFNLWLEENAVALPDRLKTIYGAYELCQARWVYEKTSLIKQNYFKKNKWVKSFLYNYAIMQQQEISTNQSTNIRENWLLDLVNNGAYFLQKMYMNTHLTNEDVRKDRAFFHPRDTKSLIYTKWKSIVKQSL